MNSFKNRKLDIIQYENLQKFNDLLHFTSTRAGGVSSGNYASLNLGRFSGDTQENIQENFSLFCTEVGIESSQLHLPYQTHENHVQVIDEDFLKQNKSAQAKKLHGFDALITNLPNQCIGISTADCVPILLYDPKNKAIGAVHAGWRGTCSQILKNVIETLTKNYKTNPTDLIVAIGPSISVDVYKVGLEVVEAFKKENFEIEKIFQKKSDKYYLDLWTANKITLLEAGVQLENIEISEHCTYSEHERFFSARRLGIKSGRITSGIMIKAQSEEY
ncbi:MAG TPA: peptidoglycan editing factor PgeF [Bacteroidales bacterium]|nr:peptidoglycan editing factor PgeF [Bacteroidales bacterium]